MQGMDSGDLDALFAPDPRTAEARTRDFWTDLIASVRDEHRVIAGGCHFVVHLFGSPGFGGEAYRVTWLDAQRPPIVCSLSCQGVIPEAFWEQLPNNAVIQAIPSLRAVGPIEAGIELAALLDRLANSGGARASATP